MFRVVTQDFRVLRQGLFDTRDIKARRLAPIAVMREDTTERFTLSGIQMAAVSFAAE